MTDQTTIAETIAEFVAGFELEQAPPPITPIVKNAFIDTLGVMIAGSQEPASKIASEIAAADAAAPNAGIIGHTLKTSTQNAALVNGVSTQALDFDLSFMSGQSTAALIPGLLPLAETTAATPAELIRAYIAGAEVCARLAQSCPTLSTEAAWHGAGVFGTIAAATSYASLARCKPEITAAAVAISTSLAAGIGANFGTMTKPLHTGNAARNAILAVALAQKSFTANPAAIEGRNGFYPSFARGLALDHTAFSDLGSHYYLDDPGYKIKPFACGGVLHCAIEAALNIKARHKPDLGRIAKISIGVTPHAKNRAIDQYPWSEDSSRFSPRYLISHALVHDGLDLDTFTHQAMADEIVRALSKLCEIEIAHEYDHLSGSGNSPARVAVALNDGSSFVESVEKPAGTRDTPMSDGELAAKFMACATRVYPADIAREIHAFLSNMEHQPDCTGLWRCLRRL